MSKKVIFTHNNTDTSSHNTDTTMITNKTLGIDSITSFCGHLTYIEKLWKLGNEARIDPMEMFVPDTPSF